ncbi:Myb-like DNA-binding domain protein [Entomortierella beljakovae]|nr:Myb-like DNA-binding domain protein [Entomortierella beljakovae]
MSLVQFYKTILDYNQSKTASINSGNRKPHKSTDNPWTKEEDDLLFSLRQQGVPWKAISPIVNRHVGSCYTRYYRFLDPFLADAIEDDQEEQARIQEAVKASQKILETNVLAATLERSWEREVTSVPYHVQGPWTAKDRERLEDLIKSKVSWSGIARELQRNQESCKEKWNRIQKDRRDKLNLSKAIRKERWSMLRKVGFAPYHRTLLVREIERQLASRRSNDPLGLYNVNDYKSDGGAFAMMMMHQMPDATSKERLTAEEYQGSKLADTMEQIVDWELVAGVLKNKFPVSHLKEFYRDLATAKLLWTPDEDERLIRAVIRLGPPERRPELWTMIKDAFGDTIRESEEYRNRWRELDMPSLDRDWDHSEKSKFWRRWLEFQSDDSLFSQTPFSGGSKPLDDTDINKPDSLPPPLSSLDDIAGKRMWDLIAEGLEYRHARDCQIYFESVTSHFPRDNRFNFMAHELANYYTKPQMTYWTNQETSKLLELANSYIQKKKTVSWKSVSITMGRVYTPIQCKARWEYWTEKQQLESAQEANSWFVPEGLETPRIDNSKKFLDESEMITSDSKRTRFWTDYELTILEKGVRSFGYRWAKIRDSLLPHRTTRMLRERYWRSRSKKSGKFTEQERSLLELAIETFGENADWGLIASQIPGRTSHQCRMNWKYGRTQYVQKLGEPWTDLERERLKSAVKKFGDKKWSIVSEFVIGKTPNQCRMEWKERLDPDVNRGSWSGKELDLLMERVETHMSRKEEEEKIRIEKYHKLIEEGKSPNINIEELSPRYNGKMKVDWNEIAKGMDKRTPGQCRVRFAVHRGLYHIQGNF